MSTRNIKRAQKVSEKAKSAFTSVAAEIQRSIDILGDEETLHNDNVAIHTMHAENARAEREANEKFLAKLNDFLS